MSGSLTEEDQQFIDTDPVLVDVDMDDMTEVATQLRLAKKQQQPLLEERIRILSERLFTLWDTTGTHTSLIVDVDGTKKVARPVAGEDIEVDLDRLRELAGQNVVDVVLAKPKVSVERWNQAIETGVLSADIAAQCCTYKPRAPYVGFVNAHD